MTITKICSGLRTRNPSRPKFHAYEFLEDRLLIPIVPSSVIDLSLLYLIGSGYDFIQKVFGVATVVICLSTSLVSTCPCLISSKDAFNLFDEFLMKKDV